MPDRRVSVTIDADIGPFSRGLASASVETKAFARELRSTDTDVNHLGSTLRTSGNDIDRYSGRLELFGQALAALGPAAVPIGAAVVPAIAGLANQLGFAALGAGTAVLAFHGVGDALKALNTYQVEPTAEHLQKLNETMHAIGPAGADFVRTLDSLGPVFHELQGSAQAGLFPGLTDGLTALIVRVPDLQRIIATVAETLGHLSAEAGKALAGPEWDSFFQMLESEAKPALTDVGRAIGSVVHGLGEMSVAFIPLSNDFGAGLAKMAANFDRWATGLSATDGFQNFLSYIESTGPQVLDLLGALGNALVQIAQAAAPLGGPILHALTAFANAIASVADSDLGTPIFGMIAALSALRLALKATEAVQRSAFGEAAITSRISKSRASITGLTADVRTMGTTWLTAGTMSERETARMAAASERVSGALVRAGKGAALIAGVGLAASGAADQLGATNTVTLALAGSMAGPFGAAAGAVVGSFLDMKHANDDFNNTVSGLRDRLHQAVAAGDAAGIKSAADAIHKMAGGLSSDLPGPLKDVTGKLSSLDAEATRATTGLGGIGFAVREAAAAIPKATQNLNALTAAMRDQRTAALAAFDAETAWRQAVKDAAAQAAKSNAGIRGSSDAAIANRQALSGLAAAWNNQSDAVKNNTKRFQEARHTFIQTAVDMGVPIARAREMARVYLQIPKSRLTKFTADTVSAQSAVQRLKAQIAGLHNKTVTVTVAMSGAAHALAIEQQLADFRNQSADGSTVPKVGPYADRFPYLLAPGEEVISNRFGQADRHRDLLKAINAGRLASGGTAGGPGKSIGGFISGVDVPHGNDLKGITSALHGMESSVKSVKKALDLSQKSIDKEKTARDNLVSQRDQLSLTVTSGLTSNVFDTSNFNGYSSFGDQVLTGLSNDIANATNFIKLSKQLKKEGVHGTALQDAQSQGVGALSILSGMSPAELKTFQHDEDVRAQVAKQAGSLAGQQNFGAQIAQSNRHLAQLHADNKVLQNRLEKIEKAVKHDGPKATGEHVSAGVNKAAAAGKRRKP